MQKILLILILAIFAAHFVGVFNFYYYTHPWIDIPMHMAGGLFIALLFVYLFTERTRSLDIAANPFFAFVAGIGFVMLVGVVWEWYEYLSEVYIQHAVAIGCAVPNGLFDTLKDLFDDFIGGIIGLVGVLWIRKR